MGKREIHICDVCKADLPFGEFGFPKFQGAEVRIQLHRTTWGEVEWLAGWKGELCAECVAIVNRTAETFHREMNQRQRSAQPGEHVSSTEAAPAPRICASCGHPEKPHRFRHQFKPWSPGMPEPKRRR